MPQAKTPGMLVSDLVDGRAAGDGVHLDAGAAGKFILRDQAGGEQEDIAGVALLGAGDGLHVEADLGDGDSPSTLAPSMSTTVWEAGGMP